MGLILITVTLCRPKTEAGSQSTCNDAEDTLRPEGTWRKSERVFSFTVERNSDPKTWGACLKQEPELGYGSLDPCPQCPLYHKVLELTSAVFKCALKIKLRSVPLCPDTAVKPQAGDVHEAETNEGYAGNVTSFVHSSKKRHSSILLKQNSNCEKQTLIVKYQTLPTAMSILSSAALRLFGFLP